jgi:hypothetical protein
MESPACTTRRCLSGPAAPVTAAPSKSLLRIGPRRISGGGGAGSPSSLPSMLLHRPVSAGRIGCLAIFCLSPTQNTCLLPTLVRALKLVVCFSATAFILLRLYFCYRFDSATAVPLSTCYRFTSATRARVRVPHMAPSLARRSLPHQ